MFAYRVGRVQRPHGLEGDVQIILFRPRRDTAHRRRTIPPVQVALTGKDGDEREVTLVALRFTDPSRVVAKFEGIDRAEAETLTGRFLDLDVEQLPELLTDSADAAFGLDVATEEGEHIGEIVDVRDNGAQPLLVIEAPDGREHLLPFVDEFVKGVDGGTLIVAPIPGLFD